MSLTRDQQWTPQHHHQQLWGMVLTKKIKIVKIVSLFHEDLTWMTPILKWFSWQPPRCKWSRSTDIAKIEASFIFASPRLWLAPRQPEDWLWPGMLSLGCVCSGSRGKCLSSLCCQCVNCLVCEVYYITRANMFSMSDWLGLLRKIIVTIIVHGHTL